jgi:hypothetical protein
MNDVGFELNGSVGFLISGSPQRRHRNYCTLRQSGAAIQNPPQMHDKFFRFCFFSCNTLIFQDPYIKLTLHDGHFELGGEHLGQIARTETKDNAGGNAIFNETFTMTKTGVNHHTILLASSANPGQKLPSLGSTACTDAGASQAAKGAALAAQSTGTALLPHLLPPTATVLETRHTHPGGRGELEGSRSEARGGTCPASPEE